MRFVLFAAALLLTSAMYGQSSSTIQVDSSYLGQHDIVYLEPEYDSFNGLPLGNGDLGGMLWFTDEGIKVQLNKIDLYDKERKEGMTLRSAGRLTIDLGVPCYSYMHLADFESRLSLRDAQVGIKSSTAFVNSEISSWVSANSNVWVFDCVADYGTSLSSGAINRVSLERWGSREFRGWYGSYEEDPASGLGCAKVREQSGDIILEESFGEGLSFAVVCRVLGMDAKIDPISDRASSFKLDVAPSQKYKVLLSVVTSNDAEDPTSAAITLLDSVQQEGVKSVKRRHQEWWHNFWSRSFIHLDDNYLENVYYIRRYLMASSSRGLYPSPFNGGLWTTNYDHRQWVLPHHWNTQESYWGLAIQNDCDLLKPYIETYFNMMPQAQELAKAKGADDGLFVTEAHDFMGNMVSANWGNMTTNYTPASQISKIMWEYYSYTKDKEYLRDRIYPFMKGSAQLYLSLLQWDEQKQEYFIFPAQPYEHAQASNLKNTISDRYMIESLFKNCIVAACELGVDDDKIEQWQGVIDHLWQPPVLDVPGKGLVFGQAFTQDGDVYPSVENYPNFQGYHFDAHTTAVYPAGVLGIDQMGSRNYDIAKNVALAHPSYRNAITPGAIVSARLGLADKVLERLQCSVNYMQQFNQGLFYNLDHWFCFSRYTGKVEDEELYCARDYIYDSRLTYNSSRGGQSGLRTKPFVQCGMETTGIFATAVNEMLLQSHEGKIRLFPATPEGFEAAFTLRAEGAFMVSSSIDTLGFVETVEIYSEVGTPCRVVNPWSNNMVVITTSRGKSSVIKEDENGLLSFKTKKGESYTLKCSSKDDKLNPKVFYGELNRGPKYYGEATLGKPCTFKRE